MRAAEIVLRVASLSRSLANPGWMGQAAAALLPRVSSGPGATFENPSPEGRANVAGRSFS
jgi:hypothetical protein